MKRAVLATFFLLSIATFAAACGGGSGGGGDTGATQSANFAALRDTLRSQLDSIGVNIGAMPDDILNDIVNRCHELQKYANQQSVSNICDSIRRAHDNNDAAALDQIVAQLGQLKPK